MRKSERLKTYQTELTIAKQILITYENLMEAIANYNFCPRRENSYGARQNQTNEQILREISLLKPVLLSTLNNINFYLCKITDNAKMSTFDCQLISKLKKLRQELKDSTSMLTITEGCYHKTWNFSSGRGSHFETATKSSLGKSKKDWKNARNDACYTILKFYKQMNEINNSLQEEDRLYSINETNQIFLQGMNNIVKGPNYYCYLKKEDRKTIIEENINKKRMRKRELNNN